MPWLVLKVSMCPIIAMEINNNISEYKELVQEIQITSDDNLRLKLLTEYMHMRASFKARMEEMYHFYYANSDDEKIHYFENYRLKIKKAL